jgi:hypothetical protein
MASLLQEGSTSPAPFPSAGQMAPQEQKFRIGLSRPTRMLGGELPLLALTDESRMSVTMREKPTKRIVTCGVAGVIASAIAP